MSARCGAAYCIKVENLEPHGDYTSWVDVTSLVGLVVKAVEAHAANDLDCWHRLRPSSDAPPPEARRE
jgi:hypothetical protein